MTQYLQPTDTVWTNIRLLTMQPEQNFEILTEQDLIVRGDKILAIVPRQHYPHHPLVMNGHDALMTPGLIDCHTHLVFAGNRATEWQQRLQGVSYTDIAAKGGGINTTVQAVRNSSAQDLYRIATQRLQAFINEGVTTLEIKTGYGLDLENEGKLLAVINALKMHHAIDIAPTLLAAHALPSEYQNQSQAYIDYVCREMLPQLAKTHTFEAVDVFCEKIAFTVEQSRQVYTVAKTLNKFIKGHCEQLSLLGGSELVATFNGLSADHVEYLDESGVKKLAQQGTVATLLPLAFYFLKETQIPPIEYFRHHHVPMAVSSDFNPGTAPFASLRLAMNMAAVLFQLTVPEVMQGVTVHAARALGREKSYGQIQVGFKANLCLWSVDQVVEIFYELGRNPLQQRIYEGKLFT